MRLKHRRKSRYSSGLSFYEDKVTINRHVVKEVLLWILTTLVALLLAFLCFQCFGFRVNVSGGSMEPGIEDGRSVLVNRLSYRIVSPQRGDVIAFYPGGDEEMKPSIKRVVALPGDTVQISDGVLLVNGIPSALQDIFGTIEDAGMVSIVMILEEGEYFVLGDDPQQSEDSRSAGIGMVEEEDIIGEVWIALPYQGSFLKKVE